MPRTHIIAATLAVLSVSHAGVPAPKAPAMRSNPQMQKLSPKDQQLHDALKIGPEAVRKALKNGANPNVQWEYESPLTQVLRAAHSSRESQSLEIVRILLEAGTKITPRVASYLSYQHNIRLVDLLLKHGWSIDKPLSFEEDDQPITLLAYLMYSPESNKFSEQLIGRGANPSGAKGQKTSPLQVAAQANNFAGIRLLLKHGAKVNPKDAFLLAPAASAGDAEFLKELLALGINVRSTQANSLHLLHLACSLRRYNFSGIPIIGKGNRLECAKLLLDAGIQVNGFDDWGQTPLMLAADEGLQPELVALLLAHGANPQLKNNSESSDKPTIWNAAAPPHYIPPTQQSQSSPPIPSEDEDPFRFVDVEEGAAEYNAKVQQADEDLRTFELLVKAGTPVDLADDLGRTALMSCAERNRPRSIQFLTQQHADFSLKDKSGNTALHYAAGADASEAAIQLLESGAKIETKNKAGLTPLLIAAGAGIQGYVSYGTVNTIQGVPGGRRVFRTLIEKGANVNAVAKDGLTALHYVAMHGDTKYVALLLQFGAQVDSPAKENTTPLMTAVFYGQIEVVKLLLKAGANRTIKNRAGHSALDIANQPLKTDMSGIDKTEPIDRHTQGFIDAFNERDRKVSQARQRILKLLKAQ